MSQTAVSAIGLPKIVSIVGPTSSGKTALSLELAKRFKGEIINADARQIYKGFIIGTGQPTKEEQADIPHHLFGFLAPDQIYSVTEWKAAALAAVRDVVARGKLPILVGGTGLYIQSLVDNYEPPQVPPQPELRAEMASRSLEQLIRRLEKADPEAATWVDLKNRRRVERALEVVTTTGTSFKEQRLQGESLVDAFLLGLQRSPEELRTRINAAIERMFADGWKEEVQKLHASGIPWDAPAMTSIGYRDVGEFIRGDVSYEEALDHIRAATWQYAKRQLTWFKKDQRIQWHQSKENAVRAVEKFLEA
ncbi:tRNA (adenosine(37)-N6)-dimethylallyltransferase MiaA [Patescibacteria group bacterium]|nr:tRNA (adenosine(37)-N6)-dimethylallyltransferase MiaA [Patescibacteria group bacterium]